MAVDMKLNHCVEWDATVAPYPPLSMVGSGPALCIARRMAIDRSLLMFDCGDMYEGE